MYKEPVLIQSVLQYRAGDRKNKETEIIIDFKK